MKGTHCSIKRYTHGQSGIKEIRIAVQFRQLDRFLYNSITNHTKRGISSLVWRCHALPESGKAFDY